MSKEEKFNEELASILHKLNSGVVKYILQVSQTGKFGGDVRIPALVVERLKQNADLPYEELSPAAKEKLREDVDMVMSLINNHYTENGGSTDV